MSWNELKERRDIMLCYPFEEKRLLKWPVPFIVQPKLDGERCRAVFDHERGSYTLLSSSASQIISCPHIIEALNETGLKGELDGELYRHGMEFEQIHSRVSRTVNLREDASEIEYHIFDLVVPEARQSARTAALEDLDELRRGPLKIVDVAIAYDLEGINNLLVSYNLHGYEGIVVRKRDGLYKRSRSTEIMKFKPRKSDIYLIVGYEEELDKNKFPKASLGAFICSDGPGREFNVGSGFTRQQRQYYWGMRDRLVGHKVKVLYQHTTNGGVPRFPIFSEVLA